MKRVVLWVTVGGYLSVIFALSSQTDPLPSLTSAVSDKILHCVEYGGLGVLLAAALRASGIATWRACLLALAAASLYGLTDELHQLFVPGRSCDVFDWMADTVGGSAGATASTLLARWRAG